MEKEYDNDYYNRKNKTDKKSIPNAFNNERYESRYFFNNKFSQTFAEFPMK